MNITKNLLTGNHSVGRNQRWPIDTIVIHVMEGSMASARSWFMAPESQVSSHYGIDKLGNIEQWVAEENTAWANGRVDHPTADIVLHRLGSNPNNWTISIEHEGSGKEPLTDAQKEASTELIYDICSRRDIPIDRQHVLRHHEIYSLKSCPGVISVDELVAIASAMTG